MSRTSKYYIPVTIERAEQKLAELYLIRDIEAIDRKIRILQDFCSQLYPSQRVENEQPSALHTAATS